MLHICQGNNSVSDYTIDFCTLATTSGRNQLAQYETSLYGLAEDVKDELVTRDLPACWLWPFGTIVTCPVHTGSSWRGATCHTDEPSLPLTHPGLQFQHHQFQLLHSHPVPRDQCRWTISTCPRLNTNAVSSSIPVWTVGSQATSLPAACKKDNAHLYPGDYR